MKRHPFDPTAFIWGCLFLVASAYIALRDVWNLTPDLKWVVPGALIAAGAAGIANALRPPRKP